MSVLLRLPPELVEFNLREPPRSLLIRGEPGAGKSTLGLTVLSAFRGKRILITSRVTKSEIEHDYPWLGSGPEGPVEVIESFAGTTRIDAKARAIRASPELVASTPPDPELEQLWLPDAVMDAFSRIGPGNPGMVLIDSWDALVEQYVGSPKPAGASYPDREEIERLLLGLLGRGRAHLVLVVEREGPTQLDYLVDGVVACEVTSDETRLERWVHIKKMRGVRISHPLYPYTLETGRFLCIAPMGPEFRTRLQPPQPVPDPQPGWLWPGSMEFAAHFGRLQLGRSSILEVPSDVPVEAVRLLVSPIQSQVLAQGGRVLVILPPSLSPADVWETFQTIVSPEQFINSVRIYAPAGISSADPNAELLEKVMVSGPAAGGPSMTTRMPEASKFLREGAASGIPNLGVVWLNGLRAGSPDGAPVYSPETLPAVIQKTLSNSTTHIVMIGAPTDPLLGSLQEIASKRLSMRVQSGRVFVLGVQPVTPALVLAQSDNGNPYHLIRIV
ncbi:MAG TPA: gas vesicle protein GvpD P-loop domain-containing protein [Thermoplasmata archaeon]|nr:gas vesicle protein GvpD P-loop domain-containing protein [Thermoplasmata archaeon]